MPAFKDLTGQRFGRLLVIKREENNKHGHTRWLCKCDCGTEKIVNSRDLKSDYTKSCGCLNKEKMENKKLEYGESSFNFLYRSYKHGAKIRNHCFMLSKNEFKQLISENCFYCGKKPEQTIKLLRGYGECIYNGIDRIDSSKGYTVDNTVSCCGTCNKAKQSMSQGEFYDWIDRVYNHIHKDDK